MTTCTVNFNDLYLKSKIGKVSHYRPGILFDHLICLNVSVRLKVSHSAEECPTGLGRGGHPLESVSLKPVTAGHNLKNPISVSVIYILVGPGVNQIPVTASVTCDREGLQKAGVSGYQ